MGDVRAAAYEQSAMRATRATKAGSTPTGAAGTGTATAEQMAAFKARANAVETPTVASHLLEERRRLYAEAERTGAVQLTAAEAARLLNVDEPILLERADQILRWTEGSAQQGMHTIYKLGDEYSGISMQLRMEHPDLYTGKWNPVSDKSWTPGEENLMSLEDRVRYNANPPMPTEVVNYTPRYLGKGEIAQLSPELQSRYFARLDAKNDWTHYTSPDHAKLVDYSDPAVIERYGPMWVPEDPAAPVIKATFWKDPDDLRIYLQYQTSDGVWHAPRRSSSDVDTYSHGAGSGAVTYEQSENLQYKGAGGQLGEGDTVRWSQKLLGENDVGSYVLKNPENKKMLIKAIDTLTRGESELLLRQDLNGFTLTKVKFTADLENLKDAAKAIDAVKGWDADQRNRLAAWGVFDGKPPRRPGAVTSATGVPSPIPKPPPRPNF
jgi:hypothetical protein